MQWTDESIAFLRGAAAMNRYYETIAEKITPQLQENAHVCDAGCGIGELSLALKPYCHHVTAVDADELAIKTLEAHLIKGVTAICGDMETPAPEKPYDAMVFCLFGRTEDTLRIARKQCRTKRRCACSPLRRRLYRRRKQYETASFDLRGARRRQVDADPPPAGEEHAGGRRLCDKTSANRGRKRLFSDLPLSRIAERGRAAQ